MANTLYEPDLDDLERSFEAPSIEPESRNASPRVNSDGFDEASSGFYDPDSPQGPASAEFGGINGPRRSGNNSIAPDYGEMFAEGDNNPDLSKIESGGPVEQQDPDTGNPEPKDSLYNNESSSLSTGTKTKKGRGMLFTYATGLIFGGAISGMGLITFMLPNAILSWIEEKVDAVTNQMLDTATDRMVSSYMRNVMGPKAKSCGNTVNINCTVRVEGDGYLRSVFRTIQQAQTDDLLAKKGVFMSYDRRANGGAGSYKILTPNNPAGFDLTDIGENTFDFARFQEQDIGPREAYKSVRKELNTAFKNETRIKKYLKVRYHLGIEKTKYGLKTCTVFCSDADRFERKIVDNKLVNRVKMARIKTITKFNARTGLLMECIYKGCVDDLGNVDDKNPTIKNALDGIGGGDPENPKFKSFLKEVEIAEAKGLKGLGGALKARKELLIKKVLTSFFKAIGREAPGELAEKVGSKFIPIIGQVLFVLMIVDMFSRVQDAVSKPEESSFFKNIDKIKTANMVEEYSRYSQVASESRFGALSMDEYGELFKSLPAIGQSRFFQAVILSKPEADVNKYQSDCPNSGKIVDGDSICQEYKLGYQPQIIRDYNNSPISDIAEFGLEEYRKSIIGLPLSGTFVNGFMSVLGIETEDLPGFLKNGECTRLSLCDVYRSINGAISWTVDSLINLIPGADTALGWLAEKAKGVLDRFGISEILSGLMGSLMPMADCTNRDSSDHMSCIFGGAFSVGDNAREEFFGAPEIDQEAYIKEYQLAMESQKEEFKSLSLKDRILNFSNSNSLVASLTKKTYFKEASTMLAFNPFYQFQFASETFKFNSTLNPTAYAESEEERINYEASIVNQFGISMHALTTAQINSATNEEVDNCGAEGAPQHTTCPLYKGSVELVSSSFVENTSGEPTSNPTVPFVAGGMGSCEGVEVTHPNAGTENDIPIQIVPGTRIDIFQGYCKNAQELIEAAKAVGIVLDGGGFRTYQEQVDLYNKNCSSGSCNPATAKPGSSKHESGLAIDFSYQGSTICYPRSSCNPGENAAYDWLVVNAGRYGFKRLPKEAWHFSDNGR